MKSRRFPEVAVLNISALVLLGVLLLAPVTKSEVTKYIRVAVPGLETGDFPIVPRGGWPLVIQLSADKVQGILSYNGTRPFPEAPKPLPITSIQDHAVGIMLFANPDGTLPPEPGLKYGKENYCLSFLGSYFGPDDDPIFREDLLELANHSACPSPLPEDEKHLYFATGTDPRSAPANYYDPIDPSIPSGPSPRVPGLVILSDSGIGNVYEEDAFGLVLKGPRREARNLAKFVNSVDYALRDGTGRTVITATINAPQNLITPYAERDASLAPDPDCDPPQSDGGTDRTAVRINGSPEITYVDNLNASTSLDGYLRSFVVTLRIFVVNGQAPGFLEDRNGDNIVDSRDARILAYELLSDEKIIRLRIFFYEFDGHRVDFDGNGCVGGAVAPAGAGGLSMIPD